MGVMNPKIVQLDTSTSRETIEGLLRMKTGAKVRLSMDSIEFILNLFREVSEGNPVTTVALDAELEFSAAARMLDIPEAVLMHLIQVKAIPSIYLQDTYKVKVSDLIRYREEKQRRREALQTIVDEAERLNLYEE